MQTKNTLTSQPPKSHTNDTDFLRRIRGNILADKPQEALKAIDHRLKTTQSQ